MSDYIIRDVESIQCDMRCLSDLLNIVIDDFEDNGENAERRKLTASALYIVRDHLALLVDMQAEVVGRMMKKEKEAQA